MKLVRAIVAVSALASSVAFASEKKGHGTTPNCEVKGKKVHVKDEAACQKKKGTWLEAAAPAGDAAAPVAAPTETAPAAPAK